MLREHSLVLIFVAFCLFFFKWKILQFTHQIRNLHYSKIVRAFILFLIWAHNNRVGVLLAKLNCLSTNVLSRQNVLWLTGTRVHCKSGRFVGVFPIREVLLCRFTGLRDGFEALWGDVHSDCEATSIESVFSDVSWHRLLLSYSTGRTPEESFGVKKCGNHRSRLSPQRVRQPCPERTAAMAFGLSTQRATAYPLHMKSLHTKNNEQRVQVYALVELSKNLLLIIMNNCVNMQSLFQHQSAPWFSPQPDEATRGPICIGEAWL